MQRLFLTSEFAYSGDFLKEVLPLNERKLSVAYIANAADVEDFGSGLSANREKFVELGFEIIDVDLRQTQHIELENELDKVDAIYVDGGCTPYLLHLSNQSGFSQIIRQLITDNNLLYIGTSAGSIIAGPSLESTNYIEEEDKIPTMDSYDGFGLVDFVIVPHIGGDFYKENKDRYSQLFNNIDQSLYPHICLKDSQAVWIEGEAVKIIETV